ncbi:hypothetical protein DB31_1999 [Hyalangium minutum]|uniref:Uncharacterized protein n=1 Tax=Hyalangium minutum TaxID=394096 RepID=A0A085W942_9BACT|nr:hypothetical protein DB31_1999 [Hyalangium minutum]
MARRYHGCQHRQSEHPHSAPPLPHCCSRPCPCPHFHGVGSIQRAYQRRGTELSLRKSMAYGRGVIPRGRAVPSGGKVFSSIWAA